MKPAKVHIHLYRIRNAVDDARSVASMVNLIEQDDLGDRIRNISGSDIRLDSAEEVPAGRGLPRRWLLDFVKLRDSAGPGKGSRDTPIQDLDIEADEYFGEETAALLVPQSGYMIIQYNHYGVRPGTIEKYLSSYVADEANAFEIKVVLDEEAEARYQRVNEVRRISVGVDLTQLSARQRQRGDALTQALGRASDMNAARMNIEISVGRERRQSLAGAKTWLNSLLGSPAVVAAEIAGRETTDGSIETVDLIREKLTYSVTITPNAGRRLAVEDRFQALEQGYRRWVARIRHG